MGIHVRPFLKRVNISKSFCSFKDTQQFQDILSNVSPLLDDERSSSHWRCSLKKGVLEFFAKFTGKHLCQNLFFNKVADLRPATLLKQSSVSLKKQFGFI